MLPDLPKQLPERFTLIKEFLMEQDLSTLNNWPTYLLDDEQDAQDHFIVRDGVSCAGAHLIVDIWGADQLDDLELMERASERPSRPPRPPYSTFTYTTLLPTGASEWLSG